MAKRRPSKKPASDEGTRDAAALAIPLPAEGIGSAAFWNGELDDSAARLRNEIGEWKANLSRYAGDKPKVGGFRPRDTINVNVQFGTVQNKKPQLFFQTPQVMAKAARPQFANAAPLVSAILNRTLARDTINAGELVDEMLDDNLITAGFGASKIGHDEVSEMLDVPTGRTEPVIDPFTGQPVVDPFTGAVQTQLVLDEKTGQPETKQVKRVLWSEQYWRRIPPADLRLPLGFTGARYDDAPWIAWRFDIDDSFSRKHDLDRANSGRVLPDDLSLLHELDRQKQQQTGTGYEIFYKAHLYDATERNPDRIRRLVIASSPNGRGAERSATALVHENLSWQVFDDAGRFVAGMKGYPIHPLCVRPLTERPYPKSDCGVVRDLADEKSLSRTLMIQQRRRNLPLRGFNKNSTDPDTIKKIENAEVQEMIPFTGDPRDQLFQLPQTSFPVENMSFDSIIQTDIDRITASGSNQQGLTGDPSSATESALIQKALETRTAKERERVLAWFTAGVDKVFSLIQLFASDEEIAVVIGNDGAEQYRQWQRSEIQGRFAFTLKPDSALRTNAEDERQHYLRFFNLTANHPLVNTPELLRGLATLWGLDPSKVINPQGPPPPAQEKPKLTLSLKGDDLSPSAPQYANVITLLKLYGMEGGLTPVAPAPPAQTNGAGRMVAAARPIPPIDQHDADLTGRPSGPRVS